MCLHVSPHPLCLSFPAELQAGTGAGTGTRTGHSHPQRGSRKITPAAPCPTDAPLPPQGTGTLLLQGWDPPGNVARGHPRGHGTPEMSHHLCAGAPALPPAAAPGTPGCARGRGLCPRPGCALALPPLSVDFLVENSTKSKVSPWRSGGSAPHSPPTTPLPGHSHQPGHRLAPVLGAAHAGLCRGSARRDPGMEGTSPEGDSRGSRCGGGAAGSLVAGTVAPVPSRGVQAGGQGRGGGGGAEEAASEEERGRGSRELAPAPGSPGAPTAAGGRGPAATAPAKYLPEWHRAMDQPPARPGPARQSTAKPSSARQSVAPHGKAWQSMAKRGKAWQSVALHGRAWQSVAPHGRAWQSTAKRGKARQSRALLSQVWPRHTLQPHVAVTPVGTAQGRPPVDPVSLRRGLWG